MKITAITKYKHGELYGILARLGWSQSELARKSGLQNSAISAIINLARRPTEKQAVAIQKALGDAGEYFDVLAEWPEAFKGFGKVLQEVRTKDIPLTSLLGCREAMLLPSPESDGEAEADEMLHEMIGELPPRERQIIEGALSGDTEENIGKKLGCSRGRVNQLKFRAVQQMRHHAHRKGLSYKGCEAPNPLIHFP